MSEALEGEADEAEEEESAAPPPDESTTTSELAVVGSGSLFQPSLQYVTLPASGRLTMGSRAECSEPGRIEFGRSSSWRRRSAAALVGDHEESLVVVVVVVIGGR